MASENSLEQLGHLSARRVAIVLLVVTYIICFMGLKSAFAAEARVPWPIWLIMEGGRLGVWGFLQFWAFLGFIVFVPLKKIVLGAVLTLGGAFLPDIPSGETTKNKPQSGTVTLGKIHFRGAPRYAVLTAGLLIIAASLWQGISEFAK